MNVRARPGLPADPGAFENWCLDADVATGGVLDALMITVALGNPNEGLLEGGDVGPFCYQGKFGVEI